ncbi:MAG: LPS export ABC transporter periplasmic protein LptC [Candidatus Delongbacteria bacterium]|nr:LPS export ABC transporter periplasmic protein LptC [Candidatus Delongbacteria bacterium]MBN2836341.1 LPS export ABC transporter periplasmic protein LptC [Candidatus Delongbacteria bacterium]
MRLWLYILISLFLFSCGDYSYIEKIDENIQEVPDNEGWDLDMEFTEKDNIKARMHAKYMQRKELKRDIYKTDLDSGIIVFFYNKEGVKTGKLESIRGSIDEKTNILTARDSVVLFHPNGAKLYTDKLFYDSKQDLVYTDSPLLYIHNNDTINGTSFKSDSRFETYEIMNMNGKAEKLENFKIK